MLLLFLLPTCDSDSSSSATVIIAANPSSIEPGEQMVVELRALEPIFTDKKVVPLRSENGLFFKELTVIDEKNALATFVAGATLTEVGLHSFELKYGEKTALVEMSVVQEADGPGTVSLSRSTATAGARMAEFRINGDGTHFDSAVTVTIDGAPGMEIVGIDLLTGSSMDVFFNIDIEQEPTTATVVITDGPFLYELPFIITAPQEFENEMPGQILVRGQVGVLDFSGTGPTLYEGTRPVNLPEGVEVGDTVDAMHGVSMAMRLPADFAPDTFSLTMYSYLEGGATLEIMTTEIEVADPAYLVPSPSVLLSGSGAVDLSFVYSGFDFADVTSLELEGSDLFVMTTWDALDATASVISSVGTETDSYSLIAQTVSREIPAQVVVVDDDTLGTTYPSFPDVVEGDHVFVPVAVASSGFVSGDITFTETANIHVADVIFIDNGSVVFELQIEPHVQTGEFGSLERLEVSSDGRTYSVFLNIVDSGVEAL
ncbi:MAG: hypothetical protein JXX29_03300 [Deltaproteobacteria bacterium]|nr:hypothetical protein [Deltaproteobacteria bacterium]MBN2670668.1 hypothetical protein [Deltaproteobacteria bacterium]